MSVFEVDELVDVSVKGARVVRTFPGTLVVSYGGADDSTRNLALNLEAREVSVARVAPKEWPPQPGDLWDAPGFGRWFARGGAGQPVQLTPESFNGPSERPEELMRAAPGLRLVYREGWSPEPAPAAEPEKLDQRAEAIAGLREMADWLEANPPVPVDRYVFSGQLHVNNQDAVRGKDEAAKLTELARIAEAMGVEADLRDEPGAMHPHATKTFRGGVKYEAIYVTEAYRRGYAPVEDITRAVGEVAGPDGDEGPATATADEDGPVPRAGSGEVAAPRLDTEAATEPDDEPSHRHVGGSAGGPGENSAECACGTVYDGFDTHADATAALERHIADAHELVWVAAERKGIDYHAFRTAEQTKCNRSARHGRKVPRAEAETYGRPCPRCYPPSPAGAGVS